MSASGKRKNMNHTRRWLAGVWQRYRRWQAGRHSKGHYALGPLGRCCYHFATPLGEPCCVTIMNKLAMFDEGDGLSEDQERRLFEILSRAPIAETEH